MCVFVCACASMCTRMYVQACIWVSVEARREVSGLLKLVSKWLDLVSLEFHSSQSDAADKSYPERF